MACVSVSQWHNYVRPSEAILSGRQAAGGAGGALSRRIIIGSWPSDHYFRSVCLFFCLFLCAEFFSASFDPISIKLGHMLYVWV